MDLARAQYVEAYRGETLRQQVARWHLARDIRVHCHEVRQALIAVDTETLVDIEMWLSWAENYGDEVDPTIRPIGSPEVPEPEPDALRPYLHGMSPYGPGGLL